MQFGDYRVEIIPDTEFRLDGGAMFGVVPRTLWSTVFPPDDHNRIRLNMNCVYVEAGSERILIETGIGEKWSPKHRQMYGITRERGLAESLRAIAGVAPDDITLVINTHLHFDHAGGNTILDDAGKAVPAFSNARYFVSRAELEHAETPSERDRASYLPENAGHNRSMQCWRLSRDGQTIFGFADLVPTRAHVSFPWIMGYDLYPVETLEAKKKLLPEAAREGWGCLFYHDPEQPLSRLIEVDGKLKAAPYL
jgi:glyoxylase-like metal-dependent hydrolase (beta-lactamase superfamily II)